MSWQRASSSDPGSRTHPGITAGRPCRPSSCTPVRRSPSPSSSRAPTGLDIVVQYVLAAAGAAGSAVTAYSLPRRPFLGLANFGRPLPPSSGAGAAQRDGQRGSAALPDVGDGHLVTRL